VGEEGGLTHPCASPLEEEGNPSCARRVTPLVLEHRKDRLMDKGKIDYLNLSEKPVFHRVLFASMSEAVEPLT
jgi:hypothetical protein